MGNRSSHPSLALDTWLTRPAVDRAIAVATRRPAVRVTHNPLFWLLAFVVTYWSFLTPTLYEVGHPIAPRAVSISLAVIGFGVSIRALEPWQEHWLRSPNNATRRRTSLSGR